MSAPETDGAGTPGAGVALECLDLDFGPLETWELDSLGELMAEAFSRYEPMGLAIHLPSQQIMNMIQAFGSKLLAEGLTMVARERSTGALAGALVVEDFATPHPAGLDDVAPGFAPIGALLEELDDCYRATHIIEPGTHLHLFMLAVNPNAEARGVARGLVRAALAWGRERGYRVALTEATGSASQHIFRKLGFQARHLAFYRSFEFAGQRVFSSIQEPEGTVLMTLELS